MTTFVALLRAVNVGGTGKLAMADLRQLCATCGFTDVQTYIASGNVVFDTALAAEAVKEDLEAVLAAHVGATVPVMVRSAAEMAAVRDANPFPDANPSRTVAIFLDAPPPADSLNSLFAPDGEQVVLGTREIFIAYGESMGRSKLRLPAAASGTARNMNTVAKLAAMAAR